MFDMVSVSLFLVAALVIAATPGPGIFYVAARTLSGGRDEGLASSFGTSLGGMVRRSRSTHRRAIFSRVFST